MDDKKFVSMTSNLSLESLQLIEASQASFPKLPIQNLLKTL